MSRAKHLLIGAALTLALSTAVDGRGTRAGLPINFGGAAEAIASMDFERAHAILDSADGGDLRVALERGRLALYEGRYDEAVTAFSRSDVAFTEPGQYLADVARGCARVTAAAVVDRDEASAIEVTWQDENDRALAPLMTDTVVRARAALEKDLGVTWPKPTRIVVVRDMLSLSAMTGLGYEAARTTGTVAIAKFGRVTILSPRASHHGYAWRDTVTHELTHLAVTRLTSDRAPLWLQEGVAKREEVRWREPGPFDGRPQPEAIIARGIELKIDIPLDKLGPSIAMLPSADQAAVAFAEVTSFVRYFADNAGPEALPRLLAAIKDKDDVNTSLQAVGGLDFAAWDVKWRAWLGGLPKEALPETWQLGGPRPGDAKLDLRLVRDKVRLAELLYGRKRPKDSLVELEAVPREAASDASIRHVRGRAMEAASEEAAAIVTALGEPRDVSSSYGPWWAIRGRLAHIAGAGSGLGPGAGASADTFFLEAVAQDPFDLEAACQTLDPAVSPGDPRARPLCEEARKRGQPGLGQD